MILWLGLSLGTGLAAYTLLSTKSLGFAFPILESQIAARPTIFRIFQFALGKLVGMLFLGFVFGWLGQYWNNPSYHQFLMAISVFFGIFILIYLFTESSPEIALAKKTDITNQRLPVLALGLGSSGLLIAPNIIAFIWCFSVFKLPESYIFFTNIFIGYMVMILPLFLNQTWTKNRYYHYFLMVLLFLCGLVVIAASIKEFFYLH